MYSLFEIINKDTGERLHLFNRFEKAALLRDILIRGRCKANAEVRQFYVSEYWECEGMAFDNVADLLNAFRDPHKPVTHHMMIKHAESNVSFLPVRHIGTVCPASLSGKDARPQADQSLKTVAQPHNAHEAPSASPAAPASDSSPARTADPGSGPAPSAPSVSAAAVPIRPAPAPSAPSASAAAEYAQPAPAPITSAPAAVKRVPSVSAAPARPRRARTGAIPPGRVPDHVPVYGARPFRPCPKSRKREKPLLDIVLLT